MKITWLDLFLLFGLLLAGCQAAAPQAISPAPLPTVVPLPGELLPVGLVEPTLAAVEPSPTPAAAQDPAVQAVAAYAQAVGAGDYSGAAEMLSRFSLAAANMTPGEAADELRDIMAGEKWTDFQAGEARELDSRTRLVQVTYTVEAKGPENGETARSEREEVWPARLENGVWRYNRANLVDFRSLGEASQTTGGLTVKPRRIERYTDRVRLVLLVQNQTNDPIVLGQTNEILAVFSFGETRVEAEPARFIFDRLRSYPDTAIEAAGWFEAYPDGVVIRQWKNYQTEPWFTFRLSR